MNPIKGISDYWQKFLHEVLTMVKQLAIATLFLTLSCADLIWNELVSITSKLILNPVLVARHFQYRVEMFFKIL